MSKFSIFEKTRIVLMVMTGIATLAIITVLLYKGFLYKRQDLQSRFEELHNIVSEQEPSDSSSTDDSALSAQDKNGDVSGDTSGTISWKQLAATQMTFKKTKSGEALVPNYGSDLTALNHQEVSIRGFMFPLDASNKQTHFLLSPYSPSCPFCLPAGANELIEVRPTEPVIVYGRSVMVKGQFELLTDPTDLQGGMLYRIIDADVK